MFCEQAQQWLSHVATGWPLTPAPHCQRWAEEKPGSRVALGAKSPSPPLASY